MSAVHNDRTELVAVKVLLSDEGRQALVAESNVLRRLRHPNLVCFRQLLQEEATPSNSGHGLGLAMEYVSGASMEDWLRSSSHAAPLDIAFVLHQVAVMSHFLIRYLNVASR